MIDPTSITPGFLSASAAATLQQTAEMTIEHDRVIQMLDDEDLDHFPAQLTAYDATSGAYSWSECAYDANAQRYVPTGARTGSPSWNPAYPIGSASPPSSYPVDVWLRRRAVFSGGACFEFDWQGGTGTTTKMVRIVDPIVTFSSSFPNVVKAYTVKWSGPAATDYADDELIWLELL